MSHTAVRKEPRKSLWAPISLFQEANCLVTASYSRGLDRVYFCLHENRIIEMKDAWGVLRI